MLASSIQTQEVLEAPEATLGELQCVLLDSSSVLHNWEFIRQALIVSLVPVGGMNEEVVSDLQSALAMNRMRCWMMALDKKLAGIILTTVVDDTMIRRRSLLVYHTATFVSFGDREWTLVFDLLKEHARRAGCVSVVAYTESPRIINVAKRLGGATSQVKLEVEV